MHDMTCVCVFNCCVAQVFWKEYFRDDWEARVCYDFESVAKKMWLSVKKFKAIKINVLLLTSAALRTIWKDKKWGFEGVETVEQTGGSRVSLHCQSSRDARNRPFRARSASVTSVRLHAWKLAARRKKYSTSRCDPDLRATPTTVSCWLWRQGASAQPDS
jgi:hypothetical protein